MKYDSFTNKYSEYINDYKEYENGKFMLEIVPQGKTMWLKGLFCQYYDMKVWWSPASSNKVYFEPVE